jgi:hypothetical protein
VGIMQDFEKLGQFYLGRQYNLEQRQPTDELLLYDAKDLCTHAVCVGMTGSGKTGLCLSLLEEAAIDGIPALCIDPKGDLGNLMLTFPELRPSDFRPWVDPAEATRKGQTPDEFAESTAKLWKDGLAAWGMDGARISKYRDAVDITIYTPGSTAGLSLTVLRSFTAPPEAIRNDSVSFRERISVAASGLLALLGIDTDPLKSREHILLSNLLETTWKAGKDLDLSALIRGIQSPPFDRLGVLDVDSFFPAQERFQFALQLNNLLASPGFSVWREGDALDVQRLLYTPEGRPRLTILSLSHLSDAERMFFVTILLNEVLSWMRRQSGTSSLRALLYMDEVFGFFPPTANPPSKTPMLTLLKQARAFGLGVMLATQNPVDLDYKGLSNCGTWFLGRLQTERDKARVLDGLEGASAAAGAQFNRQEFERILSGLGNRVFLMNNVHDDVPVVFQTRWALSYLRGPLSREQIETLMASRKAAQAASASAVSGASSAGSSRAGSGAGAAGLSSGDEGAGHPVLPPDVPEVFLTRRATRLGQSPLVYRPGLYATARIHFENRTAGVDESRDVTYLLCGVESLSATVWDAATELSEELETQPQPEGESQFGTLIPELAKPKTYSELTSALKDHLYRTQRITLWKCKALKESSVGTESEGDFRTRLTQRAREQRDLQVAKLRTSYAPKLATLQERLRKAEQKVEKEKAQAGEKRLGTLLDFGTTVLGVVFGRKMGSATNLGRAASTVRSASRMSAEERDVAQAQETADTLATQWDELNAKLEEEVAQLQVDLDPAQWELEEIPIRPKKSDITITRLNLAWTPWLKGSDGSSIPAWE